GGSRSSGDRQAVRGRASGLRSRPVPGAGSAAQSARPARPARPTRSTRPGRAPPPTPGRRRARAAARTPASALRRGRGSASALECLLELEPPAKIHTDVAERRRRDVVDVVVRALNAQPVVQAPLDVRTELPVLAEPRGDAGAEIVGQALADGELRLGLAGDGRVGAPEPEVVDDRDRLLDGPVGAARRAEGVEREARADAARLELIELG